MCTSAACYLHYIQSRKYYFRTTTNVSKKKIEEKELADTERPEIKMTKSSTKRECLEEKMIEYIDLTKKTEVDAKKDKYISLQLEAMGESIRESFPKRQAYSCLYEMQAVVFRYVSNQLDRQEGQQMGQHMRQQIPAQMPVPPCTNNRTTSWREATEISFLLISRCIQFFFANACLDM